MAKTKKCDENNAFNKLKSESIVVSVNGLDLPLKIGDKIMFDDDDEIVQTVMKIQISEDNRVLYCLEWFNGAEFKTDWVTSAEIWHMQKNKKKCSVSGFSV